MSTVILTRPNTTTCNHNKISLNNHSWDVSAKPFIPRSTGSSINAAGVTSSPSPPSSSRATPLLPEFRHPPPSTSKIETPKVATSAAAVGNGDPVSLLFKRAAAQNVHMGSSKSSASGKTGVVSDVSTPPQSQPSSRHSSLPSKPASPVQPPRSANLCDKAIKNTQLMATTEYFMARWNEKNDITSVTHAILEGTYLESRKNPATSTVPSLFGRDASPFPPVLIHRLPSLMSIWKTPYENESFTAGILGAHPEFAIQVFRHEGKVKNF